MPNKYVKKNNKNIIIGCLQKLRMPFHCFTAFSKFTTEGIDLLYKHKKLYINIYIYIYISIFLVIKTVGVLEIPL